jgi:hypothetical protein
MGCPGRKKKELSNMRYLVAFIVILALCLPARAEILIFKTVTSGQQLDVASKVIEKKSEGGYIVVDVDLSNTASIDVNEVKYLHYETKAGRKLQHTSIPSDLQIIMVDSAKGKKMILRCFDGISGSYVVVNGNAILKDVGGILRYTAGSLSGSSVWQQADFITGSGSTKLALDLKATQTANIQRKNVIEVIQAYEQTLEQTKGYIPE